MIGHGIKPKPSFDFYGEVAKILNTDRYLIKLLVLILQSPGFLPEDAVVILKRHASTLDPEAQQNSSSES
jgi:hypothetical protein